MDNSNYTLGFNPESWTSISFLDQPKDLPWEKVRELLTDAITYINENPTCIQYEEHKA